MKKLVPVCLLLAISLLFTTPVFAYTSVRAGSTVRSSSFRASTPSVRSMSPVRSSSVTSGAHSSVRIQSPTRSSSMNIPKTSVSAGTSFFSRPSATSNTTYNSWGYNPFSSNFFLWFWIFNHSSHNTPVATSTPAK